MSIIKGSEAKSDIRSIETKYTSRANPRRGYHDSETRVVFMPNIPPERQEEKMVEIYEDLKSKNMWCYKPRHAGPFTWTINYGSTRVTEVTHDSGD